MNEIEINKMNRCYQGYPTESFRDNKVALTGTPFCTGFGTPPCEFYKKCLKDNGYELVSQGALGCHIYKKIGEKK